jgi:CheY-like chemotaxis protein
MLSFLKRKARLLVLDDDPSMQKLMATLLRREGHAVDVVSEASAAIEQLRKRRYDGLLLDIMTPTEGGMTVIKHLRAEKAELLKRVVLVTASPDSILRSVSGDVFAVVHKPFAPETLLSTIAKLVGQ